MNVFRRLVAWMRRDTLDDQLADEINLHIAQRTRALVEAGMPPHDAAVEARRAFGNVMHIRETSRDLWGFPRLDTGLQDVRFGMRLLRRTPGFAVVAVLSLAIGIGAAIAVFSLADTILFKKLPVRDPDALTILRWISGPVLPFESLSGNGSQGDSESSSTSFSLVAFERLRDGGQHLADVIGFADLYRVNLGIDGAAELGNAHAVSGNYFDVLGVPPHAGRPLRELDDLRNAPPVAMIGYALWQRRFGGDPDIVGRSISINGIPVTIVGVTRRGFRGTMQVGNSPDVFVPLGLAAPLARSDEHYNPNHWWVLMMARLKPGVSASAVASAFDAMVKETVAANKAGIESKDLPRLSVEPGARGQLEEREGTRQPLLIMTAVVTIVLIVACVNIANLLLARASSRGREIAMRVAIGAPRSRIVRQLLTESLLLAAMGGAAGLILAQWLTSAMLPALEQGDLLEVDVSLDWRAVAFTIAVGAAASLLFGLLPALRVARSDVLAGVQESARGHVGSSRRIGLSGALISVQVALSLTLVAGAGLLVGSVRNLERIDAGFDPSNMLLFRIDPTLNGYDGDRLRALHTAVLERVRALPGVAAADMSSHTLISGSASISEVYVGEPPPSGASGTAQRRPLAWRLNVGDEFLKTMGIRLLSGRGFGPGESTASQPVAIVNATFVRVALKGGEALGRRFKLSGRPNAPEFEIVGVASDAKFSSLRADVPVTVYLSYRQAAPGPMTFEVKTAGDPLSLVPSVRAAIAEVEPNVPIFDLRTQIAQMRLSVRRERLFAQLATMLGAITLALCAIGLYGLLIASVTRRVPEIGVRMALGAGRREVRWMVLRQSFVLVAAGLSVGIPAALMSTEILESLLFGLTRSDWRVLFVSALLLLTVSSIAAYIPARRASQVDPLVALRTGV